MTDVWGLYEDYKTRCEDQGIEPMPFQEYKEDFEEDQFENDRQESATNPDER